MVLTNKKLVSKRLTNKKSEKPQEIDPESWLDEFGDYLFQYAIVRVKKHEVAEDLVQDTFVAAFKNYESFRGDSAFKTWITSILKNKIFDYYRKSRRTQKNESFEDKVDEFNNLGIWKVYVPNWAKSPDETINDQEFLTALSGCISKLNGNYAQVFSLKHQEALSSEEICKILDISPSNYWVMMHRVRTQLRKCLESNWYNKNV